MKKIFTLLALAALAAGIVSLGSCKKDGDEPKNNYIKINGQSFDIPASLGYYFLEDDEYYFYWEYEAADGAWADVNLDITKNRLGQTLTMEETDDYWYFSTEVWLSDDNELDMYGDNEDREDIQSGTILVKSLGGHRFEITVKAKGKNGDTFEMYYKGVIRFEDNPS